MNHLQHTGAAGLSGSGTPEADASDPAAGITETFASGYEADLRACQELAAAASTLASLPIARHPAGHEREPAAQVLEILDLLRRLESVPHARSAGVETQQQAAEAPRRRRYPAKTRGLGRSRGLAQ